MRRYDVYQHEYGDISDIEIIKYFEMGWTSNAAIVSRIKDTLNLHISTSRVKDLRTNWNRQMKAMEYTRPMLTARSAS
jgi:hypothetical protein